MNEDIASMLKKIKEVLWIDSDDEDEYIAEAEKFIEDHIPIKAVEHYLPSNMAFIKDEYYSVFLNRLISKYHEIESYRNLIANGATDPMWEIELKKGENLGF